MRLSLSQRQRQIPQIQHPRISYFSFEETSAKRAGDPLGEVLVCWLLAAATGSLFSIGYKSVLSFQWKLKVTA